MRKYIAILVAVVIVLTGLTAYVFASIGYRQGMEERDFSRWQVWIDDDYNVCIELEDSALYVVPWGELAALPEELDE